MITKVQEPDRNGKRYSDTIKEEDIRYSCRNDYSHQRNHLF